MEYSNQEQLFRPGTRAPSIRTLDPRPASVQGAKEQIRELAAVAAWLALVGLVAFNLGWVALGLLQGPGYSVTRDTISELSALTAQHARVMLVVNGFCGVALMSFALFGLRAALAGVRGGALASAMIAFSALGLDELSDAFFRLNCQTADGCTQLQEISSWHGVVHATVGIVTLLVLMAAPFVVARALRKSAKWEDLARPSMFAGVAIDLALLSAAIPHWGGGAQRLAMVIASMWIGLLALRVRRWAVSTETTPVTV
jgi:Protein of unknown function (DUF998)